MSQEMQEWLEAKIESQMWEHRKQYKQLKEILAAKYQALFRDAEAKGIHLNCAAIENINRLKENAMQKIQDELETLLSGTRYKVCDIARVAGLLSPKIPTEAMG